MNLSLHFFTDEEDNVRIIPAFTQPAPGNRGGLRHAEEEGKQGKSVAFDCLRVCYQRLFPFLLDTQIRSKGIRGGSAFTPWVSVRVACEMGARRLSSVERQQAV